VPCARMPDRNVAGAHDGADSHVLHLRAELVGKHVHHKARTPFSECADRSGNRPQSMVLRESASAPIRHSQCHDNAASGKRDDLPTRDVFPKRQLQGTLLFGKENTLRLTFVLRYIEDCHACPDRVYANGAERQPWRPMGNEGNSSESYAEQLRVLFRQLPIALVVNLAIATIMATVLAPVAGTWPVIIWFASMLMMTCFRYAVYQWYLHPEWLKGSVRRWDTYSILGAGLTGSIWGIGAVLLLPPQTVQQVFVVLTIGGMCAGAVVVHSSHFPTLLSFLLPAIVPLAARFILEGTASDVGLGGMMLVFAGALSVAGYNLNRSLIETLRLKNELLQAQKIEALGTLAGGIAHDFNNLLGMIGANAEVGLALTQTGEGAHASFGEIVKATARARDVVRQILLFSRREESVRETIPLLPVVEDALKFLRSTLPANVEFRTTLEAGLPPVSANASHAYLILVNLGTNAGHAMRGGGVLSVSLDRSCLTKAEATAFGSHSGEYIRLTVQDTGVGMSRETLDRIFEPFFTTKGLGGTGLGLSVVHGLVKDHGGTITVESELGKGSTFRVYLPARREPVKSARREPVKLPTKDEGPVRGNGQHIMYIDDEQALGSAMKRLLELLGYRCTFYSNPEIALEEFRSDPDQFNAVISDMTMPLLSGFDVAKALHAIRPEIPVALTSGTSSQSTDNRAFSLGIRTWISKPATVEELSQALGLLLQKAA
jgi:signal transduction histidine kinase/CheY-like chemotaxis protein